MVWNLARHLDYAKKEVVAARYYDLPAKAVEQAVRDQLEIARISKESITRLEDLTNANGKAT